MGQDTRRTDELDMSLRICSWCDWTRAWQLGRFPQSSFSTIKAAVAEEDGDENDEAYDPFLGVGVSSMTHAALIETNKQTMRRN